MRAVVAAEAETEAKEDNFEGFEVESDDDSYVDLSESDTSLLKFEEFKWYEEKEEREKVNAPVEEDEDRSDSSWDSDGSYDPKDPNPENHQFVQYKSFEILQTLKISAQLTDPESNEGTMFGILKKLFDRNMKNRGETYVYALWFNLRIFSIVKEEDLRGKWETMVVPKRSYKEFEYKCFCGEKNILKRGDNSYMPVKSVIMHLLECSKFKDALKTCYLSYSLDKFVETCKAITKHLDPEVTSGAAKQKICALVKRLLDPTVKPDLMDFEWTNWTESPTALEQESKREMRGLNATMPIELNYVEYCQEWSVHYFTINAIKTDAKDIFAWKLEHDTAFGWCCPKSFGICHKQEKIILEIRFLFSQFEPFLYSTQDRAKAQLKISSLLAEKPIKLLILHNPKLIESDTDKMWDMFLPENHSSSKIQTHRLIPKINFKKTTGWSPIPGGLGLANLNKRLTPIQKEWYSLNIDLTKNERGIRVIEEEILTIGNVKNPAESENSWTTKGQFSLEKDPTVSNILVTAREGDMSWVDGPGRGAGTTVVGKRKLEESIIIEEKPEESIILGESVVVAGLKGSQVEGGGGFGQGKTAMLGKKYQAKGGRISEEEEEEYSFED